MSKVLEFLRGKKSHIAGLSMVLLGMALQSGLIDKELYDSLLAIGTGVSVVFLRLGISKLGA